MKILLISDTHKLTSTLKNEVLAKYANDVQIVVHLGDYARDLTKFKPKYPNLEMAVVGGSFESGEEKERILEVGGDVKRRILIMHGHTVDVKTNLDRITYYAQQKGADACFFGHTHEPVVFTKNGVFFMNPGSLTMPRVKGPGSFGLVTIFEDGEIDGDVIYL